MSIDKTARDLTIPVGVVLRCKPGVTRWARQVWQTVGILPGASPATMREIRREGDIVDFHAATVPLTLWRTDVEGYREALAMTPASVFVILRPDGDGVAVHEVTASVYEAQDYTDSGEEIVEPVPMPDGLAATVKAFCDAHYEETPFVKRRRDKTRVDRVEDGIGDARIRQTADVYRAPGAMKPEPER